MKKIFYISIFIFLFFSCNKDKSDQRKMIGTWKMELVDGMNGVIVSTDTISIDKQHFFKDNESYDYILKNSNLYLLKYGDTLSTYCYSFINENKFTLGCFTSPGGSYSFILNKIL